jgi:putative lipoic acid-binding regulatory protein
VKVFSATLARDRDALGETVTEWLRRNQVDVVERVVTQSSDNQYHCISITLFFQKVTK